MSAPVTDRDGVFVPIGYPTHLIQQAREKADHVRIARKRAPKEVTEHQRVVDHVRGLMKVGLLTVDDMWATMNEGRHIQRGPGGKMKGADLGAAARDKKRGLHSGVSDIIIGVPFTHQGVVHPCLAVEMKRAWRSLSDLKDSQRRWLAARRRGGWVAEFCFGAREAIELIHLCYGW